MLRIDAGPGADDEEVAELSQQLRKDLLELDVETIDLVHTGEAPSGTKGDTITLSALAVTLAPAVLEGLISVVPRDEWRKGEFDGQSLRRATAGDQCLAPLRRQAGH